MKEYTVGGSKVLIIFGIFFMLIVIVIMSIIFGSGVFEGAVAIPFALVMPLMLGVPLAMVIFSAVMLYRQNFALAGKREKGVVYDTYYSGGRNNTTCYVRFIYKNQNGESCRCKVAIYPEDKCLFEKGKEIPIYVNGEYACFKIEEIRSMENYDDVLKEIKEDNKEEFFVCPYCDNRYKNSLDKCPHCGAKRL
jgi:hypothetical protein